MSTHERGPNNPVSIEEAEAILESLISDKNALKREVALSGKTELSATEKAQYLNFAASILEAMQEFAGRGFSLFSAKPSLRLTDIDVDDPESLKKARAKLELAARALRDKRK